MKLSYVLTRVLFLRALAGVYFVAFLVAYQQNEGLLGDEGLLPAKRYFQRLKDHVGGSNAGAWDAFQQFPTLLWFLDFEGAATVNYLQQFALAGLTLSGFLFYYGHANTIIMTLLWILYFSIDTMGQRWYSFGWETQLLETGFIAIFMVPLWQLKKSAAVPRVAIYANWWLIFRIMLGAGLIKIRGDQCWRDLTCMDYHYETQPVPNPLSWYMHHNFKSFHRFETMVNHIVELVTPWFMFLPRPWRLSNGLCQITFQLILIVSGNLSFLNWLTLIPSICFLDDQFLLYAFPFFFSDSDKTMVHKTNDDGEPVERIRGLSVSKILSSVKSFCFACMIAYLSVPVVRNLLALNGQQAMNTSFGNFKLVNTYGAFGSITKVRTEVILQGTTSDLSRPDGTKPVWKEYEFKCKPGNIRRRPCVITPYHYRLDWLMWFAAFGDYNQHPWLMHLVAKLLSKNMGGKPISDLMAYSPFNATTGPPKFIRAEHYEYKYSPFEGKDKTWWTRRRIGEYFPPISLDNPQFQTFGAHYGFDFPKE
jgi:lipase maturation factor 1